LFDARERSLSLLMLKIDRFRADYSSLYFVRLLCRLLPIIGILQSKIHNNKMVSRKRAKGKQRKKSKLKNEARGSVEQVQDVSSQKSVNMLSSESKDQRAKNGKCLHLSSLPLEFPFGNVARKHHVDSFIDTYAQGLGTFKSVVQIMEFTLAKHTEVWKDSELRKRAINSLLSFGTTSILRSNLFSTIGVALALSFEAMFDLDINLREARFTAIAVNILDKYDGSDGMGSAWVENYGYLFGAGDREIVHFFKKRISCSCLDELYYKIKKSQDRVSECFHCKQSTNHNILKICGCCKYAHYCSRECQVADWPSHKATCKELCSAHEKVKKGEGVRYCSYDEELCVELGQSCCSVARLFYEESRDPISGPWNTCKHSQRDCGRSCC